MVNRITISKQKQRGESRLLKEGKIFYRVKNPAGETIQDFKTKTKAQKFASNLRKKYWK